MILNLFSNPADIVFFSAIGVAFVLLLIVFIVSKVVQNSKDKKYEAGYNARMTSKQESQNLEAVPAEEVEETEETAPAEEVEETEETAPAEEVEETKEAAPVVTKAKTSKPRKTTNKSKDAPVTKGRTYNGKYEVFANGDGYQYRLKASNGEQLIVSEVYISHEGVLKAIAAVKRNVEKGEIKIIEDKHGMFKFKLISGNYRVIALGSNYSTEKSAVRASESFKKFAVKADIVEIENPSEKDVDVATPLDLSNVEHKTGGKFVIEKYNGEFSWDLKASNGQILCQADGYTSKSGVLSSIESFKKNAETGSFKIIKDKNDNYHYNIYTPSGRVAAIGETYSSRQLAESAANSVASYFKNAEIVEKKEVKTEKKEVKTEKK